MGRNYFSKYGGPYFRNDGFSRHTEEQTCIDPNCSTTMAKIKKFFNSRRKKEQAFFYTKPSCLPSNKEE
jgi:hypothetical protein